jgi:hypothetical protein
MVVGHHRSKNLAIKPIDVEIEPLWSVDIRHLCRVVLYNRQYRQIFLPSHLCYDPYEMHLSVYPYEISLDKP